jgi:prophage antirepressor-like protein
MDIIRDFFHLGTEHKITIKLTSDKEPLFQANQIGDLLGIKSIRSSLRDFADDEKVVISTSTQGGNQLITFVTHIGLSRLIFQSRKPIAREFHRWTATVIKNIWDEKQKELYETVGEKSVCDENYKELYKDLEKQLEKTNIELAKYKKRNQMKYERGDRVYVFEDTTNEGELVYKIGYTKNLNERIITYDTTRFENRLKFEIKCVNGRLLEAVVHHILRKSQDVEKNEWFHSDLDAIINVIKTAKSFIDNSNSENIQSTTSENVIDINYEDSNDEYSNDENNSEQDNKDIYEKFIDECFEKGDFTKNKDYIIKSVEISGRFRTWNMGISIEEETKLFDYLKENYTISRIWDDKVKVSQKAYKGLKLLETKYIPKGDINEYDRYINEMCNINPIARVPTLIITQDFMKWKLNNNINCSSEKKEYAQMRSHLLKHFFPSSGKFKYQGNPECSGFWGISLKHDVLHDSVHQNTKLRKTVYKINTQTNIIVDTYASLSELSATIDNDMFHRVKHGIPYKGFLYSYTKPVDIPNSSMV